jgi:hypothetical protein
MALFKMVAKGTLPGEAFQFGLWGTGSGALTDVATAWGTALPLLWSTAVRAFYANEVVITELDTASIDTANLHQISRVSAAVSLAGTSTAEMLPHEVAHVVSLRTAVATRSGRGRFYLPPLGVDKLLNGRVTAATVSALVTASAAMIDSLQANGVVPVLVNRTTKATTTINQVDIGDVPDVQRRRRGALIEARTTQAV